LLIVMAFSTRCCWRGAPSAQLGNSSDIPVHVGLKKLARSVAWLGRSDSSRGAGCVFPAQQLKREQLSLSDIKSPLACKECFEGHLRLQRI
jgi:hypothetical protein